MLVLVAITALLVPTALATIDNSAVAKQLENAGQILTGDFSLTNVATGKTLGFSTINSVRAFLPGGDDSTVSFGIWSGNHLQLSVGNGQYCPSAQWNVDANVRVHFDHAAVLYACLDADNPKGTLEHTKQQWLAVPCGSGASSSKAKTGSKLVKIASNNESSGTCQRDQAFICAHPEYVSGHYDHPECQSLLNKCHNSRRIRRHARQNHRKLASRASKASGGTFCLVTVDHLDDMVPRAIGSGIVSSVKGATLVEYDPTDESQHWQITPA